MNKSPSLFYLYQQDFEIKYKIEGHGVPLLLLHGFCGEGNIWDTILTFLIPHFKCIIPDFPGYGQSKFSASFQQYHTPEKFKLSYYAEGIIALLYDLNIKQYFVAGHSMGGYIGLEMLRQSSDNLLNLILVNSHPFADDAEKINHRKRATIFIEKYGTEKFIDELYNQLFSANYVSAHPLKINRLKQQSGRYSSYTIQSSLFAMLQRSDFSTCLTDFQTPIFHIAGNEDLSISKQINHATAQLPGISQSVTLDQVGHMAMIEKPERCAQHIFNFCIL